MSCYQDGYDRGYQAAIDGERELTTGTFLDVLDEIMGDYDQLKWEEGYRDGYKAGEKEREENE